MNLDELLAVARHWARWTYPSKTFPEVQGLDDVGVIAMVALNYPGGWTEFLRRPRRRSQTKFPSEGEAWKLFAERYRLEFANGLFPYHYPIPPIAVR